MLTRRLTYTLLGLILVLYLIVATLYALKTPPWQTPDEPAHYNYVIQVASDGCCPRIEPQDWDAGYLEELKAAQFPPDADLSDIAYEDHQPPLYYLLASTVKPVCTQGCLFALRMISVALGAGTVIAAFVFVARLLPGQPAIGLAAAAFVAFLPQHVAMLASANNDSLAGLVMGIVLVVAITYIGNPVGEADGDPLAYDESSRPHAAALGGLAAAAFWTKLTLYLPVVLVAAAAIMLRWRLERMPRRWLMEQIAWAGGLALVVGAIWWGRNVVVYGWPDWFGLRAHDAVVSGQLRTADHLAAVGLVNYLRQFLTVTYHSYWGQFGWMGVPMPPRFYLGIGVFSVWNVTGVGLAIAYRDHLRLTAIQQAGVGVGLAAIIGTILNYLSYNLTFVQFQGRYLFTALIPFGLLASLGGWGWATLLRRWLAGERWARWLDWLPLAAVAWMPLLVVWALFRFVVPNL